MKYLLPLLFWALSSPSDSAPVAQDAATQCPTLRVAGGEWLGWRDLIKTPSGSGNSIRLLDLIQSELKVAVEFTVEAPLPRQLRQMETGELDMILGLFPIGDRLTLFHFTDAYFLEPLYLYHLKGHLPSVTDLNSLINYRFVLVRGASYGAEMDRLISSHPERWIAVGKHQQSVAMVAAGRADFLVGSAVSLDLSSIDAPIIRADQPIAWQQVTAGFSRATPCHLWIPAINQLIRDHLQGFKTAQPVTAN